MRAIRRRLTYANVVSTLALFLVLAGGAAWAARVPKKSVGPRQLKANAVTTAKIKANAVTTRKLRRRAVGTGKIKDGAVESTKIADGSVGLNDLNQSTLPYSRVGHRAAGYSNLVLTEEPKSFPLGEAAYVQAADENDSFISALDVFFPIGCEAPRSAYATLLVDSADPLETVAGDIVATGVVEDLDGGGVTRRVELGAGGKGTGGNRFEPGSATTRKLSLTASAICSSGGGVTALFGGANVIVTK